MKLFVYGIFLDESARKRYGMSNPRYATVKGYATEGEYIVQAREAEGLTLTGLIVDVAPKSTRRDFYNGGFIEVDNWEQLDKLEGGYDRIIVRTTSEEEAFMYAKRGGRDATNKRG